MQLNGACLDAFPDPQANCMQVRRVEIVVVCLGQPRFAYVLWVHCDFDLINFPRRGRGRARRRSRRKGLVAHWPKSCCDSFLKSPHCPKFTLSKVHAVLSPKPSRSKGAKPYHAVRSPGCPKSTLSKVRRCQKQKKKKSKFGGNPTRSGVRVRGLRLVWTSALTRSDRDQHQTRSRTCHQNPTCLVSPVLLTSLLEFVGHNKRKVMRYKLHG